MFVKFPEQLFPRTHTINYFLTVNLIHIFTARLDPVWYAITVNIDFGLTHVIDFTHGRPDVSLKEALEMVLL